MSSKLRDEQAALEEPGGAAFDEDPLDRDVISSEFVATLQRMNASPKVMEALKGLTHERRRSRRRRLRIAARKPDGEAVEFVVVLHDPGTPVKAGDTVILRQGDLSFEGTIELVEDQ